MKKSVFLNGGAPGRTGALFPLIWQHFPASRAALPSVSAGLFFYNSPM